MHTASDLQDTLEQLAQALQQRGWMMATAESCTGGMISAACTDLPGSSAWFDCGFVTYSNAAKTEMLGVPAQLIEQHGAVSEAVVRAMAEGAVAQSHACVSVAVSGIAGPGGGSAEKPVGTVWLAWHTPGYTWTHGLQLPGQRTDIRQATVHYALKQLIESLRTST